MTELERLEKAILDLHGCKSKHVESMPIHETFEGKTVWQGVVEVFVLYEHPKAEFAYAWSYKDDSGKPHYVAVLGMSPIHSAEDALKAYVVADHQRNKI